MTRSSLCTRRMTMREIQGFVEEMYPGVVSPKLISQVTDAVIEEVPESQTRPLEPLYPVVLFDALRI